MKKRILAVLALAAVALVVAACGGSDDTSSSTAGSGGSTSASGGGAAEKVTWDLAMVEPVGDYKYEIVKQFADDVAKRTDGGLTIKLHPNSELYGAQDVWPALFKGQVQMAVAPTVGIGDAQPQLGVANLPFLATTMREAETAIRALSDFYTEQLDSLGAKFLMTLVWPPNDLFTKNGAVSTVDDWKGLKVRAFDVNSAAMVEALGGEPTSIEVSELYQAMQRGLADGALQSSASNAATKMYEIVRFQNLWNFTLAPTAFLAVNDDAWSKLPAEYQDAITGVIEDDGLQDLAWKNWYTANDSAMGELKSKGMKIVDVSAAERAKARKLIQDTVWKDWQSRAGASGQEALDIVQNAEGQ